MNWGTGPLKLLMTTVPPNLFVILSDNLLTFLFRHVSHSQPLFSIFVTRGRDKHIINHMFLSLFFHLYLLPYFFKLGSTSLQLTAVRCLARSEGSWRGRWGVDKGEECGHCAFPVCVYLRQTERKKEREREESKADQILLQVFHKQHNSANRFPSASPLHSLLCSSRSLPMCWWIRLTVLSRTHHTESVLPHHEHKMIMWQTCHRRLCLCECAVYAVSLPYAWGLLNNKVQSVSCFKKKLIC